MRFLALRADEAAAAPEEGNRGTMRRGVFPHE
jgi:hypothetical protein